MRLFTYVLAAALLWAVAASGPATSTPNPEPAARSEATAARPHQDALRN
jgi:hypothetical protein